MMLPGLSLALLDAIEEPAMVVVGERVDAANSSARAVLGERIVGRDVRFVLRHPDALELIFAGRGGEQELSSLDGREQPWTISVRPLPEGVQLVRLLDRSAVRSTERMRVDFVANASHELRTPLTTMIGYSETLAETGPIDEALRIQFGTTIHGEARRMLRIVEDLMSLSRIEADRFVPPTDAVSLDEIARIAAEHGQVLARQRKCAIEVDLDPAGPIAGDFGQLLQLADNLVGNAVRYGCIGEATAIRVTTRVENRRAVLRVIDEGDGILLEHLPRVTERFYRVDAARSRDSGGTGLGLSIVKHIAERHRATLDIRSQVGKGTEVIVSFPLLEDPAT
ncbi:ATP-binding protein [Sphingomonas sp.]|uniref:ATP-binding protein n=1 Tax=Sphingomonas sp. TaxID=28214 RepID=UPI003751E0F4